MTIIMYGPFTEFRRIQGKLIDEAFSSQWVLHAALIEGRLIKVYRHPRGNKAVRRLQLISRIQRYYRNPLKRHIFSL